MRDSSVATRTGAAPADPVGASSATDGDAPTSATPAPGYSAGVWPRRVRRQGRLLVVAMALLAAFAIDWLLVPTSYPVAAAYAVALILAAHLLTSPTAVAALG